MKSSRFTPKDSLDLLLDTMCNTFGGIVLIAILVALLARQSPSPIVSATRAQSEMLERRMATAEADLAEATALLAELETNESPDVADLAAEGRHLAAAIEHAKTTAAAASAQVAKSAAVKSADPGETLSDLADRIAEQNRRSTELDNALAAQAQNTARLRDRLAELSAQIDKELDSRTRKLRLPKEKAKTKGPFNVLLKHGRGYPLADSIGNRNVSSLEWVERRGHEYAIPVRSAGADTAALSRLFQSVPSADFYIAFYVYPDAFDAFAAAREAAASAGLDYGLEIVPAGADLSFGSEGTSPAPL